MALLKFKRSAVPGKVPTLADLSLGELAINTYDGKVYIRKDSGTASIVEVGGGSGVLSFNSRTGAVTLTSGDVTGALGYTPANRAGDTFTGNIGLTAGGRLQFSSSAYITPENNVSGAEISTPGAITFRTGSGTPERARFDGSGNLLIGTTTSTGKRLTLAGSADISMINTANTSGFDIGLLGGSSDATAFIYQRANSAMAFGTNNSTRLTIGSGGEVTANVDLRAPIFYDSNNTGNYLDPASTSVLNTVNLSRINMANSNSVYADGDANAGWRFGGTGYVYLNQAGLTYAQTRIVARDGVSQDSAALLILHGGTSAGTQINTDTRSPIYYDSNNTAFYLDPANSGTSLLTAGGVQFYSQDGFRFTSASAISAMRFGSSFTGESTAEWAYNRATAVTSLSVGNTGSALNTRLSISSGGSVTANVDFRAPIFLDSDNTAFFVDPAGNSILSTLRASNIQFPSGTVAINLDNTSYQIFRSPDGGIRMYLGGADPANYYDNETHWFRNRATTNVAYINANGIYAPVFYDFSDSGYYIDPNSTGTSFRGRGQVYLGPNANSRFLAIGGDPGSTDEARVATSNGNLHIDSRAGHQLYLNWYSAQPVWSEGGAYFPIYYDRNNTAFYLNPADFSRLATVYATGNLTTEADLIVGQGKTNSYIYMKDADEGDRIIHCNSNRVGFLNQGGGWGSWCEDDGAWATDFAVYSPIYYDRNNTFFYLNLDGYSQVNGFGSVNASSGVGLNIMGNPSNGAMMAFHRSNAFAINMGLDTDNVFRMGGWSAAANRLQMDMSGNLTMAGNVTAYSDARLKKDVETIEGALDLVSKMRGVRYTRIDTENRNVGVIAQEMLEVLPEVVQHGSGDDDTLSVAYGNLVGVLIEAIKELTARVAELEGK